MSFWVHLENEEGESVEVPTFREGGTQQIGGSNQAELNITYNYSQFYFDKLDSEQGLRWLDGKLAEEVLPRLVVAASKLYEQGPRDPDYWKATPGNAAFALGILCGWAIMNPKARFRVS